MTKLTTRQRAIEQLQDLGLKEYEARCFVALSRLPQGTAKEISGVSDVPRTRVYDAVGTLEGKGLVEVQHSNPKQFRAVPVDEAVETLRTEYETRFQSLGRALGGLDPATRSEETGDTHEVWSLSGAAGIESRMLQLVDRATEEVVTIAGDGAVLTAELLERLRAASDRGVTVVVGVGGETGRERVASELPDAETFVSGLRWLDGAAVPGDDTELTRILLVDRSSILVSSYVDDGGRSEHGVFGHGFDNGLVTIVRRLMATGRPAEDAG